MATATTFPIACGHKPGVGGMVIMPTPLLGNSKRLQLELQVKFAMDGTPYTHKQKTNFSQIYNFIFELDRVKFNEFKTFYETYVGYHWVFAAHGIEESSFIGQLLNDSITFVVEGRSGYCEGQANHSPDMGTLSLEVGVVDRADY